MGMCEQLMTGTESSYAQSQFPKNTVEVVSKCELRMHRSE